ncbi:MAG: hypothetical protein ACI4LQ_07370, partial [Anaerovoracaceae bacterium]
RETTETIQSEAGPQRRASLSCQWVPDRVKAGQPFLSVGPGQAADPPHPDRGGGQDDMVAAVRMV